MFLVGMMPTTCRTRWATLSSKHNFSKRFCFLSDAGVLRLPAPTSYPMIWLCSRCAGWRRAWRYLSSRFSSVALRQMLFTAALVVEATRTFWFWRWVKSMKRSKTFVLPQPADPRSGRITFWTLEATAVSASSASECRAPRFPLPLPLITGLKRSEF